MNKSELIGLIRETADILKPLLGKLQPIPEGESPEHAFIQPEPTAAAWWSALCEMATMLEYQECAISEKQMHHIKHSLGVYGGNTTLDDLWFNAAPYTTESKVVNDALQKRIMFLREVFGEGPGPYVPLRGAVDHKSKAGS